MKLLIYYIILSAVCSAPAFGGELHRLVHRVLGPDFITEILDDRRGIAYRLNPPEVYPLTLNEMPAGTYVAKLSNNWFIGQGVVFPEGDFVSRVDAALLGEDKIVCIFRSDPNGISRLVSITPKQNAGFLIKIEGK